MSKAIPDVRFKGLNGEWEQRKLESIYGKIRNAFVGTATPYYVEDGHFYLESNNVKDGQINRNTEVFINDEFYEKQKDKWLHTGDLVMVQSGHVGHTAVIPKELDNTAAHALIMFSDYREKTEPYFLNYQFQTHNSKKKLNNIKTGNTIEHILASEMKKFLVDIPKYEEQQKIGTFFKQLDDLIALKQRLIEQQQQYKKAMLQKMFPQKGERVPKVRFDGFSGDWEIRKFKDFISKAGKKNSSGKDYISYSVSNKLGLVRQDEQFEGSRLDNLDKKAYKLVNPNEFAYNPARINVGSIAFNNLGITVIVSSLYVVLKMSDKINNEYILQFIKTQNFTNEVKRNTEGSVREYLFYENFKNIKFPYTSNYKEQQKIGDFFKQLDDTIALHQKKLEDYQQLKKALLQRMFV